VVCEIEVVGAGKLVATDVSRGEQRTFVAAYGSKLDALSMFRTPMLEGVFDRLSGGEAILEEMVAVGRIRKPEGPLK